jgi:hypothetical protein
LLEPVEPRRQGRDLGSDGCDFRPGAGLRSGRIRDREEGYNYCRGECVPH